MEKRFQNSSNDPRRVYFRTTVWTDVLTFEGAHDQSVTIIDFNRNTVVLTAQLIKRRAARVIIDT